MKTYLKLAIPCEQCGGLLVVYDRRTIGIGLYQMRFKCNGNDCENSTKVGFELEADCLLLRPRRKRLLDSSTIDAMIETQEAQHGNKDKIDS